MGRGIIRKIFTFFLVFTLVVGLAPNIPLFESFTNIFAVENERDPYGGTGIGSNDKPSDPNKIVNNQDLSSLNLKNVSNGGTNLHQRGTFVGETDDYFYIYYVNKRKSPSTPFYRTWGYYVTAMPTGGSSPKGKALGFVVSEGWKNNYKQYLNSVSVSGSMSAQKARTDSGYNIHDYTQWVTEYDSNGNPYSVECQAMLLAYSKADLYDSILDQGKIEDLAWAPTFNKDGVLVERAHVYLQGLTALHQPNGDTICVHDTKDGIVSAMKNKGFSKESREDVAQHFDIRLYLQKSTNTVSYIDVDTQKVITLQTIESEKTNWGNEKIDFKWSKKGPLMFKDDTKRYNIVGGAIVPKGHYKETVAKSGYWETEASKSIQTKRLIPYGAYTPVANNVANKFNSVYNNKIVYGVGSQATDIKWNCYMNPKQEGYLPATKSLNNSLVFVANGDPKTQGDYRLSGFHLYVFVSSGAPTGNDDVVMYDDRTGECLMTDSTAETITKALKEAQKKYPSMNKSDIDYYGSHISLINWGVEPITYTFKPQLENSVTHENLKYIGSDIGENTTLDIDIPKTFARVNAGGKVLPKGPMYTTLEIELQTKIKVQAYIHGDNEDSPLGYVLSLEAPKEPIIYRASYKNSDSIDVLYYADDTGDLIYRDYTLRYSPYTSRDYISVGDINYYAKRISYKEDITAEADIEQTGVPVMTSEDKNITDGYKLELPEDLLESDKQYIIRVECSKDKPEGAEEWDAEYTIRSQYLAEVFNYKKNLVQHCYVPEPKPPTTHDYTDADGDECTCSVTYSNTGHENAFDWVDTLAKILSPLNHIFTDLNGLTKQKNDLSVKHDSDTLSAEFDLDFYSHRVDVDGVAPVFASYMKDLNSNALGFMRSHSMVDLAIESLTPNDSYNDEGGFETGLVHIMAGTKTTHGRYISYKCSHSGCGDAGYCNKLFKGPDDYTSGVAKLKINAEPSLVADSLPVADKFEKIEGSKGDDCLIVKTTNKTPIDFYPTYKMFLAKQSTTGKTESKYDCWLLGKEKRQLNAINVAKVELVDDTKATKMDSTWSRDMKDTGNNVLKGGYQYKLSTTKSVDYKVTTYIVVPKEGWVKDSTQIRNDLLKAHNELVNEYKTKANYMYASNLPEAYSEKSPNEFKIQNPHKQGSDNVQKSRLKDPQVQITEGGTSTSTMSLESLDSAFNIDNAARLQAQLQTKDWYQEHFSGFEVIKQVTTVSVKLGDISATNFLRNGGDTTNDLAQNVFKITGHKFGFVMLMFKENIKFMNAEFDVMHMTQPNTFSVRGTAYEDRS